MKLTMIMLEIRSGLPGFSGHYSEGVASLAAVVRRAGYAFELMHVTRPVRPERLAARVVATAPDVVGFSTMTHTFAYLPELAAAIRSALPDTPILLGGVHAMLDPEACIAVEAIDAVCLGEGETAILPLLERVRAGAPFTDVPGFLVRHDGRVHRNPVAPLAEDLDLLPPPDRSIFDFPRLVSTREGVLYVFASRGCPYHCAFCCNEALRAKYPNRQRYVRSKSVERVCAEIESARDVFPGPMRGIYFQDEIFALDRRWLARFAEVYPRRIGIPFNCNARADVLTPETARLLAAAGCTSVSIGLETGVAHVRDRVLGKRIGDEVFHDAFRVLHEHGIRVNTFSMVGLPGETPEEAMTTLFFNADAEVDRHLVSIFCPYPGTRLHETACELGILEGPMPDTYQDDTPLVQSSISASQVRFIHDYFNLMVKLLRRWPAQRQELLRERLVRYVCADGASLRALSRLKRGARFLLAAPYLWAGRFLLNRQSRVFRAPVHRPLRRLEGASPGGG